jgi:hypothetical protein
MTVDARIRGLPRTWNDKYGPGVEPAPAYSGSRTIVAMLGQSDMPADQLPLDLQPGYYFVVARGRPGTDIDCAAVELPPAGILGGPAPGQPTLLDSDTLDDHYPVVTFGLAAPRRVTIVVSLEPVAERPAVISTPFDLKVYRLPRP